MKLFNDIKDDEIRIIGGDSNKKSPRKWLRWALLSLLAIAVIAVIIGIIFFISHFVKNGKSGNASIDTTDFQKDTIVEVIPIQDSIISPADTIQPAFVEITDTIVNDIPLRIYHIINGKPELRIGRKTLQDTSLLFVAQAADIRKDNGKIACAFVYKGELLARGKAKHGFCAIIDDTISIGIAENSSLLEEATEKNGYFFRQYPLVQNGNLIENNPKNKSFRRALCTLNGEVVVIECTTRESFHDFAQALVDTKVHTAIYLVGGVSYGWYKTEDGKRNEFGDESACVHSSNINYIVWKKN